MLARSSASTGPISPRAPWDCLEASTTGSGVVPLLERWRMVSDPEDLTLLLRYRLYRLHLGAEVLQEVLDAAA